MSDIAARAGVSKALLYDCFPGGKSEIFSAVVESVGRTFVKELEAVPASTDLRSSGWALRELLHVVFGSARRERAQWRLIHNDPGTSNAAIRASARRARSKVIAALEGRILALSSDAPNTERRGFYRAMAATTFELARHCDRRVSTGELVEVIVMLVQGPTVVQDARAS